MTASTRITIAFWATFLCKKLCR